MRVGVGLIWGHALSDPNQFYGWGLGISSSLNVAGVGISTKAGFVSNTEMPDYIDFIFISAAYDHGFSSVAEIHANGIGVFPLRKLIKVFKMGQVDEAYKELEDKLVSDITKKYLPPIKETQEGEESAPSL